MWPAAYFAAAYFAAQFRAAPAAPTADPPGGSVVCFPPAYSPVGYFRPADSSPDPVPGPDRPVGYFAACLPAGYLPAGYAPAPAASPDPTPDAHAGYLAACLPDGYLPDGYGAVRQVAAPYPSGGGHIWPAGYYPAAYFAALTADPVPAGGSA